jgi:hypothetical protein
MSRSHKTLFFLHFLIFFSVKLSQNVTLENNSITIKWQSLIAKNKKCVRFTKKNLLRLTPGKKFEMQN